MKTKIIFKSELETKPLASAMVDVTEPSDNEPVRLKLIELLQNDTIWKDFGQDADIIEIECQYNEN